MENNDETLTEHLKSAVSNLREEIDCAFSEDLSAPCESEEENARMLRLTQYLLKTKEAELAAKEDELVALRRILSGISLFIEERHSEETLRPLLGRAATVLSADDAILWKQDGSEHAVTACLLEEQAAEEAFLILLPELTRTDNDIVSFSANGNSYLAYSTGTDTVFALVYIRQSHEAFTENDKIAAKILSDIIIGTDAR